MDPSKIGELFFRLDTFRNRSHFQFLGDINDRFDDRPLAVICHFQRPEEIPVEFHRIHRYIGEKIQRRIPTSEIIQRTAEPRIVYPIDGAYDQCDVLCQQRLRSIRTQDIQSGWHIYP